LKEPFGITGWLSHCHLEWWELLSSADPNIGLQTIVFEVFKGCHHTILHKNHHSISDCLPVVELLIQYILM
jgi:hypothetical protein